MKILLTLITRLSKYTYQKQDNNKVMIFKQLYGQHFSIKLSIIKSFNIKFRKNNYINQTNITV